MNTNTEYRSAGTPTVVVNSSISGIGPSYLRQGVRLGGMAMGLGCIACLSITGFMFIVSGSIMVGTADNNDDFWDDFDGHSSDPILIIGSIVLSIGIILVLASVGVCVCAHRQYKQFQANGVTSPGIVMNPPPDSQQTQPLNAAYPHQAPPAAYPGQPQAFGITQPQPGGYGQPQPYGYPGQPQPPGNPPEQPFTSAPTSAYPGPPAPYPEPSGGYAVQADPSYPQKTSVANVTSEYDPPPPTAPDASSQPPPYQP